MVSGRSHLSVFLFHRHKIIPLPWASSFFNKIEVNRTSQNSKILACYVNVFSMPQNTVKCVSCYCVAICDPWLSYEKTVVVVCETCVFQPNRKEVSYVDNSYCPCELCTVTEGPSLSSLHWWTSMGLAWAGTWMVLLCQSVDWLGLRWLSQPLFTPCGSFPKLKGHQRACFRELPSLELAPAILRGALKKLECK